MQRKYIQGDKFSHYSSIIVLVLIFALILFVVFFITFYALGINPLSKGQPAPMSVTQAYCDFNGTFFSIKNNLNVNMSVFSANMLDSNYSVGLKADSGMPVVIGPGEEKVFYSNSYTCPSFDSLNDVVLSLSFTASVMINYSFGNEYILGRSVNVNMTSSTKV